MDSKGMLQFRLELYEHFARIGKALGNPRRLEIVDLLAQAEHTVELLAKKTGMSIANVSQHLQTLREAELVRVRREGTYAYYSLAGDEVLRVWTAISGLAQAKFLEIENLIRTYATEQSQLEGVDAEELLARLQDGSVLLVDARPSDEYAAGHIPGALSMPAQAIANLLNELSPDKTIVAYCRSPYCLLSTELALKLREKGYPVKVLELGMSNWRLAGYPVEKSEPSNDENRRGES